MFTNKDRRIANLEAMVNNRDEKIEELISEKKDLQNRVSALFNQIYDVHKLASENTYNNVEARIRKIKELTQKEYSN